MSEHLDKKATEKDAVQESTGYVVELYWKSFKKFWWVSLVGSVLFVVAAAIYFSATYVPLYRSDVKFTITPLVSSDASNGASVYSFNYNASLASQMAETFPYVINSGIMVDIIVNDLKRPLVAHIDTNAVPDTNIFEVTVTSPKPDDAHDVINSIIRNYPKVASYVVGDTQMNVISQPRRATTPFNADRRSKHYPLVALLGFSIGLIVAFFDMSLRKTISNKRDVEKYFNGKCICEIPVVKKKRTSKTEILIKASPALSGFSESMRVLKQRAKNIMRNNNTKVIGVTSTVKNEGKTTVAYNLAKSLAKGEDRVLLVDMDLNSRALQRMMSREIRDDKLAGIIDVAAGKIEFKDAFYRVSDTMDIVFAGNENIKYRKGRFDPFFAWFRENYDYVIVDMSSCNTSSDAVSVADLCDEILYVIKSNSVSPEMVYNALKDISFSDAKVMGFVVNQVDINATHSGSYKYYGRYGRRRYGYGYSYGTSRNYGEYGYEAAKLSKSDVEIFDEDGAAYSEETDIYSSSKDLEDGGALKEKQ